MSFLKKILIPAMAGLFILAVFCMYLALDALQAQGKQELSSTRAIMMNEKTQKMKNLVELAHHILADFHDDQDLDMEQRKQSALSIIKNLRYNSNDYLWINDMQAKMIMHPIKPQLNGQNMADFKDPNGKKLITSMVEVCRKQNEGTVDYLWPKPGHDKPVPKLSYVKIFKPWNWVIGTGIYIDDIDAALAVKNESILKAQKKQRNKMILPTIFILGFTAAALTVIIRSLVQPITKAAEFAQNMADGDFTQTLTMDRKDEAGVLAQAMNHLVANLNKMFREVNNGATTLNTSSMDLTAASEQMNQGAEQTLGQANTVAAAAEEMSANMNSVAAASEQAATNVDMVAQAADEMSATINEIAQNSEKGRAIANEAVTLSQDASTKVEKLGVDAKDIDKVTEVITEISEQTNLLALNATIEAARAGEAGKGFAVVANEIKDLANQTAQATKEIKAKVGGIQCSTNDTVGQISKVSLVIKQVDEIVATIATAVEEQSSATLEVAENVSQASQGIQEVNVNVGQTSEVAGSISQEIAGVNLSANEIATSSSQVNISVHDLQNLSARLSQTINRFKIKEPRFDIGAVKSAHLQWRSKLEGLLHNRQTLRPEEVVDHHQCAFGKWYDGPEGQELKRFDAFETVGQHHEKVHHYARRIVDLFHQSEQDKATALMEEFEKSREKLFESLDELYLE